MTITYRGKGNLYLNITNRCPSSCSFCLGSFTSEVFGSDLRLEQEPELEEILRDLELAFLEGPAAEVVIAGLGEPTMRLEDVLAIVEWLRLRRIRSRLDTNGLASLVHPDRQVPAELAAAGLDRVSISLVAHNPEVYNQLCRPIFSKAFRAVIDFARSCKAEGLEVELTAVDQRPVDLGACRSMAEKLGAGFRVRPLVTATGQKEEDER
jgi:TatD family-associated radical SAM protein